MKYIYLIFLLFIFPALLFSQPQAVIGIISDAETGKPIPNVTIRILNTQKGTYSKRNGIFYIAKSQLENSQRLKISFLGYKTQEMEIVANSGDTLRIKLTPNSVIIDEVEVTGEIMPDEVIRRAIARKHENMANINTLQYLLYSKINVNMGNMLSNFKLENIAKKDTTIKSELPKEEKEELSKKAVSEFLAENYSMQYIDKLKKINKTKVIQRRQTANFPNKYNIMTLENFIDFSEDEVNILDAQFITPLHKDALSYYNFNILERKTLDDRYVYILEVIPKSTVFPTFQGTIGIIEGTYNLVEVNLKPSDNTKVQFIESLSVLEKFEEIEKNIWYPTFYEYDIHFKAQILFANNMKIDVKTTGILNDIQVNKPLPDSIYRNDTNYTVSKTADSIQEKYWEIQYLSPEETKLYADIDMAVTKLNVDVNSLDFAKIAEANENRFNISLYYPNYLTYNRVTDYIAGAGINIGSPRFNGSAAAGYCTGLNEWMGNARIDYNQQLFKISLKQYDYVRLLFSAEYFSNYRAFASGYDAPDLIINALNVLVFASDYYNYYQAKGWNAKVGFTYKQYKLFAQIDNFSVHSLSKNTDFTFFSKEPFRENPSANDGHYSVLSNGIEIGDFNKMDNNVFQYKLKIGYQIGKNTDADYYFSTSKIDAAIKVPLFEVGYGKMNCTIAFSGGLSAKNTPVQEQFAIKQASILSSILIPVDNSFLTAYGLDYGGTEFYSLHVNFNLRDWWWRALRLPLIYGRGLELFVSATNGRYFNKSDQDYNQDFYQSTNDGFYSEIGVGLGRIPIFISELVYWSLEARFGVGTYASGKWGILLNFNLPF